MWGTMLRLRKRLSNYQANVRVPSVYWAKKIVEKLMSCGVISLKCDPSWPNNEECWRKVALAL